MAEYIGYGKPCMTNLPHDLGAAIFKQILNTPKPVDKKLHEEAQRIGKEIVRLRQEEDEQRINSN